MDELAERGRAEIEPRIRHSIYREAEEILARDALLIPLFHEQAYRFARPEVEGLSVGFSYPVVAYEDLWVRR
jgi:ABC-type transport system substrate-binding protein